jgi:hypothetical protein
VRVLTSLRSYNKHGMGHRDGIFEYSSPPGGQGAAIHVSVSSALFQVERMMGFEVNFTGPPIRTRSLADCSASACFV